MLDSYHHCVEGDTSADVSQFSASLLGVDARPDPLPGLILAPAGTEKEDHSHTETSPPVHCDHCQHNTATVLITARGRMSQSDTLSFNQSQSIQVIYCDGVQQHLFKSVFTSQLNKVFCGICEEYIGAYDFHKCRVLYFKAYMLKTGYDLG